MKRSLIVTISNAVINFGLSLLKLFIGIVSNSVSILFDSINNMMDVVGNSLGAVGIKFSKKKANNDFPNGFGKLEHLISFVISVGTFIFGIIFIFYSVERVVYPLPIYFAWLYFWLLLLTVIVKIIMGIVFFMQYKKDNSEIIKSLYIDSFMDACITGCTVICYAVAQATNTIIDAILGIILGVLIIITTIKLLIEVVKNLLDYNNKVNLIGIKKQLIEKNIMSSVSIIKLNKDYEGNDFVIAIGHCNEDTEEKLKELNNENKIKIYVSEENNNGRGDQKEKI